jgi:hypothetical protein
MRLFGIRTPAGCEDLGGCNPCRGRGFSSTQDPGLLRTPGYPLQRLRRTDGARLRLKAGCPHPAKQSRKSEASSLKPASPPREGTRPTDSSQLAVAATRRTAIAQGGAERNPGSPHPMTPRPNGANGDHTHPVPYALSGHRGLCVAWSPGFHPGLSPVAPSGHEHGTTKGFHRLPSGADFK